MITISYETKRYLDDGVIVSKVGITPLLRGGGPSPYVAHAVTSTFCTQMRIFRITRYGIQRKPALGNDETKSRKGGMFELCI